MQRNPPFSGVRFISRVPKHATNALPQPIVAIEHGTFYRRYPTPGSSSNPPLFRDLTFALPSHSSPQQHWAIIGPSNAGKTTLLEIIRGNHISLPPAARSYPYLASDDVENRLRNASRAIQYVGFGGERGGVGKSGTRGAYMSARYESRREDTDFSVLDYLKGNTDLNPVYGQEGTPVDAQNLGKIIADLRLDKLLQMPMGNLSNGQTRRARIARALLGKPLLLLLDEPFMGLDPPTTTSLSPLLYGLAKAAAPRFVLALRPQDPLPEWITHVIQLRPSLRIAYQGRKASAPDAKGIQQLVPSVDLNGQGIQDGDDQLASNGSPSFPASKSKVDSPKPSRRAFRTEEKIIEMSDVHIKYGEREILGDWEVRSPSEISAGGYHSRKGLWWNVKRGERWGVFGPNGSGKTTLISLICSDHPLSYALPIKIFGRSRLPQSGEPGLSIFDIQARIGQSSPEIHAFFPRNLSIRRVVENAWADTFFGTPHLTSENKATVDACLRWFEAELNSVFQPFATGILQAQEAERPALRKTDWADSLRFGEAPFSAQRVALFLRAIIKKPEMIILDEAFSGMDEYVRDKCMLFLSSGETQSLKIGEDEVEKERVIVPMGTHDQPVFEGLRDDQTLICVSHIKEEVPAALEKWMYLPEAGTGRPARFGHFEKTLSEDPQQWQEIWGA